jgi:hypothetical protein
MEASGSRLRALAFYDAIGYPPTDAELSLASAPGPIVSPARLWRGRIAFEGREELIAEQERREAFFPRKIRKARKVARFLARLSGVRFVALCNTTALAHARDEGDLDFFVITKRGMVMQTRGWATLRYKASADRPGERVLDPVCLSFFVDETHLDLSPLMLPGDDPYFRFWFLSLLPLYDDGISSELWKANAHILRQHPHARPWMMSPALTVRAPAFRWPTPVALDPLAGYVHRFLVSPTLRAMANRDTRVVITPHVLKFHAEDGRASFRDRYHLTCKRYGLEI